VGTTRWWRILGVAIRAATTGLGPQPSATRYGFTPLGPTPPELDGEVLALDGGTPVCVEVAARALATIS
jgi:diacylglycerol kinase (ATP)